MTDWIGVYLTGLTGAGKSTLGKYFARECRMQIGLVDSGPLMREYYEARDAAHAGLDIHEWVQLIKDTTGDPRHFDRKYLDHLVGSAPNILIGWRSQSEVDAFNSLAPLAAYAVVEVEAPRELAELYWRRMQRGEPRDKDLTYEAFTEIVRKEQEMHNGAGTPAPHKVITNGHATLDDFLVDGSGVICNVVQDLPGVYCEEYGTCPVYQRYQQRLKK